MDVRAVLFISATNCLYHAFTRNDAAISTTLDNEYINAATPQRLRGGYPAVHCNDGQTEFWKSGNVLSRGTFNVPTLRMLVSVLSSVRSDISRVRACLRCERLRGWRQRLARPAAPCQRRPRRLSFGDACDWP